MSKISFSDHLDDMLDRLMNEDLSDADLEKEIKRSRAVAKIVQQKINDKKLSLDFVKAISGGIIDEKLIPEVFIEDLNKIKKIDITSN